MIYDRIVHARFIDRPNRFIAHVEIDGVEETVHVKNTGRCRELLLPDSEVILWDSNNPSRKTRYDLIAVWKENLGWVNIDSQAPNHVVKEWLSADNNIFTDLTYIKPEYTYGESRFDFYMEKANQKIFMEVKGCTLEIDGKGYFPDAPTERGVKHLRELIKAKKDGYECYIAFVIAMEQVEVVYPNISTHPEFGVAMQEAMDAGVHVLYLCCDVTPEELKIVKAIRNN